MFNLSLQWVKRGRKNEEPPFKENRKKRKEWSFVSVLGKKKGNVILSQR